MFNDLNQPNQPHPAVDDIFAETDRPSGQAAGATPAASGIETHRIGLTADAGEAEPVEKSGGPWFKIVVIVIIVVILALAGYLVYSKWFVAPEAVSPTGLQDAASNQTPSEQPDEPVVPATTTPVEEADNISEEIIPLIPGVNIPVIETPTSTPEEEPVVPSAPIDSDQDGLSDQEEMAAGTNINIVDTDADGLSDYEEIKIYGTDPLQADSDGDGYSDGDEVQNGYNPLGPGKLQPN